MMRKIRHNRKKQKYKYKKAYRKSNCVKGIVLALTKNEFKAYFN